MVQWPPEAAGMELTRMILTSSLHEWVPSGASTMFLSTVTRPCRLRRVVLGDGLLVTSIQANPRKPPLLKADALAGASAWANGERHG